MHRVCPFLTIYLLRICKFYRNFSWFWKKIRIDCRYVFTFLSLFFFLAQTQLFQFGSIICKWKSRKDVEHFAENEATSYHFITISFMWMCVFVIIFCVFSFFLSMVFVHDLAYFALLCILLRLFRQSTWQHFLSYSKLCR